jgi:nucleotide-binding universal stress UspA family protein
MSPIPPILVATDFSPHARHAVERAARLAHETHHPLALMHVLPGEGLAGLRQWLGLGSAPEMHMHQAVLDQLQHWAADMRTERHVHTQVLTAAGGVVDELLAQADALDAPWLVLGAKGAGALRRLLIGSTAERLVQRARRPVLVVRNKAHQPYRRVMVAMDFSPWSAEALRQARRVAPNAHLSLMTVFQVPFEEKLRFAGVAPATIEAYRHQARVTATQRLQDAALAAGLSSHQWQALVVEGEPWMAIVEQEQASDADLVVLGKHGQSATEALLLGSVTRQVLSEGAADTLVVTGAGENPR